MKHAVSVGLQYLALLLCIGLPLYNWIEEHVENIENDGEKTYGNNLVSIYLIGTRTNYYIWRSDNGWEKTGAKVITAPWMKALGLKDTIATGVIWDDPKSKLATSHNITNTSFWQRLGLWFARTTIKLFIPIILFISGWKINQRKKP